MNVKRDYMVMFNDIVDKELLQDENITIKNELKNFKDICIIECTRLKAEELAMNELIKHVTVTGSDTEEQELSPSFLQMQGDLYKDNGFTGKGVKIAIMDSGCQQHEDLKISGGYNSFDDNNDYMVDHRGHGTRCVGVVNMQDNDRGYVGIAPDAEMYVIKTNDMEGGASDRSAQALGMDWCITNKIDIVSLSYSSTVDDPIRREVFKRAREQFGILIFVPAGNGMRDIPLEYDNTGLLAEYPFTISVGGLDQNNDLRRSSNRGSVDFVGAGTEVHTTDIDPDVTVSRLYGTPSGTSFATPYVAGIACLYMEMFPELSPDEIIIKMKENSIPIGEKRDGGFGLPKFPNLDEMNIEMNKKDNDIWKFLKPITRSHNVITPDGTSVQKILELLDFRIGKNENGSFIKFENGLLICWGKPFKQLPNIEAGSIYRSDTKFWTFPIRFNPDKDLYVSGSVQANQRWASTAGITSTGKSYPFRQYSYAKLTNESTTNTFAIGFWK